MIRDTLTILWKERLEFLHLQSSARMIVPLLILGVYMPLQFGRVWVDSPVSVLLWTWLPLMLTTMVVADSVAGERERHTLETLLASRASDHAIMLGKIIAPTIYSLTLTALIMLISLVTLNITRFEGRLIFFDIRFLFAGVFAGILGAAFSSAVGTLVSLRSSTVRQAQQTVSLGVLAITFIPIIVINALPFRIRKELFATLETVEPAQAAVWFFAALLIIDTLLIALAFRAFRRTKLMEM